MDQFSHDLTAALEETSFLDIRARVGRWGGPARRRTRSTGSILPSAPQPTEDSSSPTDALSVGTSGQQAAANNNDGLDTHNLNLPSDSDEKEDIALRLPCKPLNATTLRTTLESDSLNETFSPARFFKPNARRKRKFKQRISMDYEISTGLTEELPSTTSAMLFVSAPAGGAGSTSLQPITGCSSTLRKRVLKPEYNNRQQLFFCGKRKRKDRYHDDHSSSMPRHLEEFRMRPRSFSSTSKPHSDRLLPLNKGLLSKIERISQQQKTETMNEMLKAEMENAVAVTPASDDVETLEDVESVAGRLMLADQAVPFVPHEESPATMAADEMIELDNKSILLGQVNQVNISQQHDKNFRNHRKKQSGSRRHHRRLLQFAVEHNSMDCEELMNDFSSSSLSSSDSDDNHAVNDTDREGDDELTDWPGNESNCGDLKYDCKRKLTKRNTLPQIKSDPESVGSLVMAEDDTVMSNNTTVGDDTNTTTLNWPPSADANRDATPYNSSEPITITNRSGFSSLCRGNMDMTAEDHVALPIKQIESEMSGETSNPFLSSPPCQPNEVREIRAGCRRVKGERPAFSIKASVNERLARFLQDPRQMQIRLPDIEIYEHESLVNLARLYSLQMSLDNGCAVLNKTSNTTQSVNIDQEGLQQRLLLSDFKRRCYDSKEAELLHK